MKFLFFLICCIACTASAVAQASPVIYKKSLTIKKMSGSIKIDGVLDDIQWKTAAVADSFTQFQPTPFLPEDKGNETEVFLLYNNEGIYAGCYMHEKNKDSIAAELTGRDGFGNNDFIGVVFDTYTDKLNGFEYFVTPLNEQWDAKVSPSNGNSEDFAWNSVWQSAVKMQPDGWSCEMFIPYSAIRFGKKNIQDWGFNIARDRRKSGQKFFWQSLDPNVNGFLTQEGMLAGFENIKPPVRLQLSPYFSTYYTHDDNADDGNKKSQVNVNGGMDVKYGLNQAFTLDMTLIPDFGQVQSDNVVLNLSPFEIQYAENRPFFTEGTELFSKGDLFYSRRIGGQPLHYGDYTLDESTNEKLIENPFQSKLVNATKISGRTQKGLGVGLLNAVTKPQYAVIENDRLELRKYRTDPLTNYNVLVLDQTLKHNSSVSFVNTSVLRSGSDYDADVAAALFDFNDKSNTWNFGGKLSTSNIVQKGKNETGYSHSVYFGKTSGRFNFNISQELTNEKYNKNDLGYFTNNNTLDHNLYAGYNWNKPKGFYNQMHLNFNGYFSSLVTPIDFLKRRAQMYQSSGYNVNMNAQTKKLASLGFSINHNFRTNDFYEARDYGRVFRNSGGIGLSTWYESNSAKKFSYAGSLFIGRGGVFKRTSFNPGIYAKIRFSSKFSIEENIDITRNRNQAGWAYTGYTTVTQNDLVIFSRRDVSGVTNSFNLKYNFNNRMGLSLRARHAWTKVDPQEFYQLDIYGDPKKPDVPFSENVNQNFNYLSVDMAYVWQFHQGSFITVAWKDIGSDFDRTFQRNYSNNLRNIINGNQFTSFSLKVIYFLDYVTFRNKIKSKKAVGK